MMGMDVLLYVETTPTAAELEKARAVFRRSRIADDYERDGEVMWRCLEFEDQTEWSAPRVVANVSTRYYGIYYERGDWPSIYGAALLLGSAFPGASVYYGSDSECVASELTPARAAELWAHWLGPRGNDYRARHTTPTTTDQPDPEEKR